FLFATFSVPILMLAATLLPGFLAGRSQTRPVILAVVDGTQTGLEMRLSDLLADDSIRVRSFRPGTGVDDLLTLRAALGSDEEEISPQADAYLVFPGNVGSGAQPGLVEVRDLGGRIRRIRAATEDVVRWHRLRAAGMESVDASDALARVSLQVLPFDPAEARGDIFQVIGFVFAMMLYVMFLVYGQMVARGVLEEKTSDIVEILVSSVRPREMMLGKIVGIGAVGLTQVGIWGIVGATLSRFGLGGQLGDLIGLGMDLAGFAFPWSILLFGFLYFVLGYLMYSAMFAGAGAMLTSEQDIQQVLIPVMMPIIVPIIIMPAVVDTPEVMWVQILSMIPVFSPILMPVRTTVMSVPLWQNLTAIGLLVLAIWVMAWIAGRIYRVGILMKGKPPTLPQLVRWIRHG
ncbi:MAG: ABC transporter permease, partial [Gemmatimonadota bacterium]